MPRKKIFNKAKRVFRGERFAGIAKDKENQSDPNVINLDTLPSPCANRPTIPLNAIENVERDKVLSNQKYYKDYEGNDLVLDLVDMKMVSNILFQHLRCGQCQQAQCLKLNVTKQTGLAAHFELICTSCAFKKAFSNSDKRVYQSDGKSHVLFPINLAYVHATRIAGIGETAANRICTFMNMPNAPSDWLPHQDILHDAFDKRKEASTGRSAEESRQDSIQRFGCEDLIASNDGSFMTRGFSSKSGFVSCINVFTNKIIGVDVRHKSCPKCHGKGCEDVTNCGVNYIGSSGGMEVVGASFIVLKVFQDHGLRITKYLGDGDSKAFSRVNEVVDYPVDKVECVNHVGKRFTARVKEKIKKKKNQGFRPEGRRSIGGKGGLTNNAIHKIQSYYGWIIHDSKGNAELMRKRILAMYKHLSSTDECPQHEECGDTCKYVIAKQKNLEYKHSKHFHIPPACMKEIECVFEDLAKLDLLEKCSLAKTQNANECFNSTVWNILPKTGYANRQLVELAVYMAVCLYNEGQLPILDVLSSLGIPIGNKMVKKCEKMDQLRVSKKRRKDLEASSGKKKKKKTDEKGDDYRPGLGD